ncbi:hypothetical protein [Actinopolymorpha pittospori]
MNHLPAIRTATPGARRAIPFRRTGSWATALIAVALLTVGCAAEQPASTGVANLGDTPPPSAAADNTDSAGGGNGGRDAQVAYSQCMRENGVKEFPDPDGEGRLTLRARRGSSLDPDSPTFKAAQEACRELRPQPGAEERERNRAASLKYSQCMREHGIKEFPDPNPDGGMRIEMRPGSEMDPRNPKFQAAQEACKSLQPAGKGGPIGGAATEGKSGA